MRSKTGSLAKPAKITIGNHRANDFAIDGLSLQRVCQRQCVEAEVVDVTRNALARLCDECQRVPGKQRSGKCISCYPETVVDVKLRVFAGEWCQFAEDRDSLPQLFKIRRRNLFRQFRLPGKNNLDQFFPEASRSLTAFESARAPNHPDSALHQWPPRRAFPIGPA